MKSRLLPVLVPVTVIATTASLCLLYATSTLADSTAANPDWGYGAADGPVHWGDLRPEYRLCKEGRFQSPVAFESKLDTVFGMAPAANASTPMDHDNAAVLVNVTMPAMAAVNITNLGHTVRWTPADQVNRTMQIGEVTYSLVQFHVHTPSEHRIDNIFYDAEMHFVHSSSSGHVAVLGFVIEATDTNNTDFQSVLDEVPKEEGESELDTDRFTATSALVDLLSKGGYYSYNGSLTSPPCSENVKWVVAATPVPLGRLQIKQLARTVGFSARPPQENADLMRHRRTTQQQDPVKPVSHLNNYVDKTSSAVSGVRGSLTPLALGIAVMGCWVLARWA